jgi:hypothetical protein
LRDKDIIIGTVVIFRTLFFFCYLFFRLVMLFLFFLCYFSGLSAQVSLELGLGFNL